jgi:hypothetical protein
MIFSNLWLLSGVVSAVLASSDVMDAIQRTTTDVYMCGNQVEISVH